MLVFAASADHQKTSPDCIDTILLRCNAFRDDWEYSYTEADSGGWGVATTKVRETLDDLKGRCDAIIHQGAPTVGCLRFWSADPTTCSEWLVLYCR